ncbi:MAG: hypothetical protein JRI68_21150 [Deltaproteobacteria bacterium]|nr:hypothetical protein [Deltaproteobacteria bacterium]
MRMLMLVVVLGLAGCGGQNRGTSTAPDTPEPTGAASAAVTPPTVGTGAATGSFADVAVSSAPAPDPLSFLAKTQLELGKWEFHGEFRLPNQDELDAFQGDLDKHWFKTTSWRTQGYRLTLIGVDHTHGTYCLWHHPQLDGREPPVVYLGSEGETEMVATHASAFVEALAAGLHESSAPPKQQAFRSRAAAAFGFKQRTVEAIRSEAVEAHPDFSAWAASLMP